MKTTKKIYTPKVYNPYSKNLLSLGSFSSKKKADEALESVKFLFKSLFSSQLVVNDIDKKSKVVSRKK